MATHVEIYEAIKEPLGPEAARMLVESIPVMSDLATRDDIQGLRADIYKWMLTFFVPLWIGVYGTMATVIVLSLVRG